MILESVVLVLYVAAIAGLVVVLVAGLKTLRALEDERVERP